MSNIKGNDLVVFFETLGCNTRISSEQHTSMWSVYTGDFFVVPSSDELIDAKCMNNIIWQLGVSREAFDSMWNEYKSSSE